MLAFSGEPGEATTMQSESQEQGGWRAAAVRAINTAAEDPEAFEMEVKRLGRRFGLTAEQVYRRLQEDPEIGPRLAKNAVIKGVGSWLKRQLGV